MSVCVFFFPNRSVYVDQLRQGDGAILDYWRMKLYVIHME